MKQTYKRIFKRDVRKPKFKEMKSALQEYRDSFNKSK